MTKFNHRTCAKGSDERLNFLADKHYLPQITLNTTMQPVYQSYFDQLANTAFQGDIDTSYSARLTHAVDNSIYQFVPQAVVYPKNQQDIQLMLQLASQEKFAEIHFTAKGGGTGTNGQALNFGVIVDLSRYFNQVIDINPEEGWVIVQSGVVKDALNDMLKPYGLFFSPDTSTSNRATLGGMIATDASGAGSLVYGKTSDHILSLDIVLADGSFLQTKKVQIDRVHQAYQGKQAQQTQQALELCQTHRAEVLRVFPQLNRFLTGYDLKHALDDASDSFDLSRLFAGAEGTLGIVTQAKLNLTPIPQQRVMITVSYASLEAGLQHAPELVAAQATAVEMIDHVVLQLAQQDPIWHQVTDCVATSASQALHCLNMVEFSGQQAHIEACLERFERLLHHSQVPILGFRILKTQEAIQSIYAMRKKAVGLLGNTQGMRKPVAFVEDAAVSPDVLADFILEFRQLLDEAKLTYGMFGHVDAGVLHVRPMLNLQDEQDEKMLHQLSDQVFALTQKYGGVMWGEHGKGVRGQYVEQAFGPSLYQVLREIKTIFDPFNRLNRSKLVTAYDDETIQVLPIDAIKRGHFDKQIPLSIQQDFAPLMRCNGNGLCFDYQKDQVMCPSFKVTADRVHSPKGRATLMREWLRQLAKQGLTQHDLASLSKVPWWQRINISRLNQADDFSHEVKKAMDGCLSCKACSSACPVKVDIPTFKAQFLQGYHQRYRRPIRDYVLGFVESFLPMAAKFPRLTNAIQTHAMTGWIGKKMLGYVDFPPLSCPTLAQRMLHYPSWTQDWQQLTELSPSERQQYVCIVQDPFTSFYEAHVLEALMKLIELMGFKPILLPYHTHGKALYVKGFLDKFSQVVDAHVAFLSRISQLNVPMIGLDPMMVLTYRDEYRRTNPQAKNIHVQIVHEWLAMNLKSLPQLQVETKPYVLLHHCSERSVLPEAKEEWTSILQHIGIHVRTPTTGCCGMAGVYGHEVEHVEASKALYAASWKERIEHTEQPILVTGHSCRSQVKRCSNQITMHPIELMVQRIEF
tara:strand:+ start:1513 stop:4596 length:3084 start_codon:yes stop_codon:yes gene_type:complete